MPASLTDRASIALMASGGLTGQEISTRLDMHYDSVGGWRNRFLEALPRLREIQESILGKPSDEVRKTLLDRPHPDCPCIFT